MKYIKPLTIAVGLALAAPLQAAADTQLETRIDELEARLNATASMMDSQAMGDHGASRTTVGGYGELHYRNLDSGKEMDFHRAVLFVGHEFSDSIRFFTEWDLEHVLEMELEQAYLEFGLADGQRIQTGVILVPVGITNETHEPPAFYGVERNPVESQIIPTTWREGGVSLSGNMANGLSYDVMLSSGLDATRVNDNGTPNDSSDDFEEATYDIRSGRSQVSEASAEDLATTARLKWTGMPGVELAASYQIQGNVTQGVDADASASLLETHAIVNRGPLTVKALYASWNIDGSGAQASGANEQNGWYIEPSWRFNSRVGVFARYNSWDNRAGDSSDSEETQTEFGASYWPHEDVVIKADLMQKDKAGSQTDEGFNLGVGYHF